MDIDDVGTVVVPSVAIEVPSPATPAALATALSKVTTISHRRRRASFSAVVCWTYCRSSPALPY